VVLKFIRLCGKYCVSPAPPNFYLFTVPSLVFHLAHVEVAIAGLTRPGISVNGIDRIIVRKG
jgi:hypothetical protein